MHLDIFKDDAFSLAQLTAAIQNIPYAPGRLEQMGIFGASGINTRSVTIEQYDNVLSLVPVSQRGAPATPAEHGNRSIRSFSVPHLKQEDALVADEILGVRAFGAESELETAAKVVAQRMAVLRRNLQYTIESHRLAAVKGQYFDAAGNTVSLFQEFGVTQQVINFALGTATTSVRQKVLELLEAIEDALGGLSFTGVRVLCGKDFWAELIEHKSVKESYLNTVQAASLRGDPRMEFEFGGVVWERHRGTSAVSIADGDAYAVPEGVPDLFITRYAPADYVETVGTLGQDIYAKQWEMEAGRGIKMEAQSNPLNLCTRPRAVVRLTRA